MPKKIKLSLDSLEITSFKTMSEKKEKIVGGYISARINTCVPCLPGGTNNWQCTVECGASLHAPC